MKSSHIVKKKSCFVGCNTAYTFRSANFQNIADSSSTVPVFIEPNSATVLHQSQYMNTLNAAKDICANFPLHLLPA